MKLILTTNWINYFEIHQVEKVCLNFCGVHKQQNLNRGSTNCHTGHLEQSSNSHIQWKHVRNPQNNFVAMVIIDTYFLNVEELGQRDKRGAWCEKHLKAVWIAVKVGSSKSKCKTFSKNIISNINQCHYKVT